MEQSPDDYRTASQTVCRELAAQAHERGTRIAAVTFSTQTPTLVFCDEAGCAVAPAIVWQDARAAEEAFELNSRFSDENRRVWFGMDLPIAAATTPAKLLWMQRHTPDTWDRTRWVLQPKDYLSAMLTGQFTTDHWCAKGIVHLSTGQVHPDYLHLLAKPVSPSPPALSPLARAGTVTSAAAEAWHLPGGTPVTVGWSDALAGILSTGAFHAPRQGFVIAGTSEIVGVSRDGSQRHEGVYSVPPGLLPIRGPNLHFGPTQAGGACLQWVARLLNKTPEQVLSLLGPAVRPSPILFRPYLAGERAPYWDHSLRASFEGLRTEHTARDFVLAVLQGVALQERLVLECAAGGEPVQQVVLAGGSARDRRWNELRAHVLQLPLLVLRDPEASLRGAALLGWASLGAFDLQTFPEPWRAGERILPDPSWAPLCEQLMRRFVLKGDGDC